MMIRRRRCNSVLRLRAEGISDAGISDRYPVCGIGQTVTVNYGDGQWQQRGQ